MPAHTYRRKVSDVQAIQFTDNADEIIEWSDGVVHKTPYMTVLEVDTPAGTVQAHVGDYIIKRTDDDIYPCGPDDFKQLYERISQ
jgi:hypothetical protein